MTVLKDKECRTKFRQRVLPLYLRKQNPRTCVARSTADFNREKPLRRKLRRQLQQDRENEWTSKTMEFEKAWKDKNPRKAYALLKQYGVKMKRWKELERSLQDLAEPASTVKTTGLAQKR